MKDAALPDAIAHNVITLKGVTRAGAAYWAAWRLRWLNTWVLIQSFPRGM